MDNVNRHSIYCQTVRVKMDFKHPYSSPSCNSVIHQRLQKTCAVFFLKVGLHLSSGCLNWILTSQDLAVKSPRHLLLSERACEPNLWKLASSVPRGQQRRSRPNCFKPVGQSDTPLRPTNSKDKVGRSCNLPLARQPVIMKKLPFQRDNITWQERGDWKAPRNKDYCSWWEKTC